VITLLREKQTGMEGIMDRLPPSAYYAEPLATAQMRGAQLGQMRESAEMRRAKMDAEMAAYGASSPREMMMMKATMTRQAAEQQARMKGLTDFSNVMEDVDDIKKAYGPAAAKEYWNTPEVQGVVSPFIKSGYDPTVEGDVFIAQSPFPGMIKTAKGEMIEGETEVGKGYLPVKTAEGEYFEERPITRKLAGKAGDTATALQKNTAFIAKTLKIPEEKALQMALESKSQSKEAFILDMIKRAMTSSMGRLKPDKLKAIEENAGSIWDSLHDTDKAAPEEASGAPEGEQDWLGATLGGE
jgi:hypothetical protein